MLYLINFISCHATYKLKWKNIYIYITICLYICTFIWTFNLALTTGAALVVVNLSTSDSLFSFLLRSINQMIPATQTPWPGAPQLKWRAYTPPVCSLRSLSFWRQYLHHKVSTFFGRFLGFWKIALISIKSFIPRTLIQASAGVWKTFFFARRTFGIYWLRKWPAAVLSNGSRPFCHSCVTSTIWIWKTFDPELNCDLVPCDL